MVPLQALRAEVGGVCCALSGDGVALVVSVGCGMTHAKAEFSRGKHHGNDEKERNSNKTQQRQESIRRKSINKRGAG